MDFENFLNHGEYVCNRIVFMTVGIWMKVVECTQYWTFHRCNFKIFSLGETKIFLNLRQTLHFEGARGLLSLLLIEIMVRIFHDPGKIFWQKVTPIPPPGVGIE